jgi:Fe2+ or Zn2+ uptake regulation protein
VPWFENTNLANQSRLLQKSYFDKQHDHIIMTDTEVIEFCDPRIQTIKKTIEEIFDIEITNHSLYLYGVKKTEGRKHTRKQYKRRRNNC